VDRVTRSKLKTDRFAVEVEHSVEYVAEHKKQVLIYAAIAVAVACIIAGIWYYRDRQAAARQVELAQAMDIIQAPVGAGAVPGVLFFSSESLKLAAAEKAFKPINEKYPGKTEGIVAASYLGAISTDQGKLADAEKYFKQVADFSDEKYASMGKLSLAQVLLTTGRTAEAEKLLRSLYEKPTIFVSKEQAAIALARALAISKPAEARKLLEPLRTERPAVSQLAITLLAELPPQ